MPPGSSSSSLSHPSVAHQCIACTIALSKRSSHATVHPAGSISHEAVNASPHTHCNPAIFAVYKLVYGQARARECIVRECIGIVRPSIEFTKILIFLTTIIKCGVANRCLCIAHAALLESSERRVRPRSSLLILSNIAQHAQPQLKLTHGARSLANKTAVASFGSRDLFFYACVRARCRADLNERVAS
eukprot:COSAG06_NODE_9830_length_1807_cov_49.642272_1_plen_187_part_10